MRSTSFLTTIAAVAFATGCHGGPKPEPPAPQPSEAELAMRRHAQDSLDAVRRVTADSLEQVRLADIAARARADSVERVRVTAETAAREAAAKSTELRTELAVMVHFAAARATIQEESRTTLDRKVAILNANPAVRLHITGACDERGSDRYNQALGTRRAVAVRQYLVGKGIDVARLDETSSGETSPIDSGKGEMAWARNRRAEFAIVSGDMLLAMK